MQRQSVDSRNLLVLGEESVDGHADPRDQLGHGDVVPQLLGVLRADDAQELRVDLIKPKHRDHVHHGDSDLVSANWDSCAINCVVSGDLVRHQMLTQERQHSVKELSVRLIWCSSQTGEVAKRFLRGKKTKVFLDQFKSGIK